MNYSPQCFDIIIVGAGLVGATTAALLATASQSLRIALVDGSDEPALPMIDTVPPQFDPRVVALTNASQQLLSRIGAWPIITQHRVCAYRDMLVWDDQGTGSIEFHASELQQDNLGHIVENATALHAVLSVVKRCENVSVLRGDNIQSLKYMTDSDANTYVQLVLSGEKALRAPLVIAADGAHSTIRTLAKMPTREWDYHHKAIVTSVRTTQAHQCIARQNFLATGPLAFLPLSHPGNCYSSIVWSLDTAVADEIMALADNEFAQRLSAAFEYRLGDVEWVDRRFCFPLKQRHAADYHVNNIALIGDAAHTIHPLAGQGVNLGLLDAAAIVHEIQRALTRQLPLDEISILRRYQRQRKGHNLEVMLLMESLKHLFGSDQLWVRFMRNAGLRNVNRLAPVKNWLAKQAMGLS